MNSKTLIPLTVIVPTYNRPKTLLETLSSFMNATFLPNEIIIVDQSEKQMFLENQKNIKKVDKWSVIKHIHSDIIGSSPARNIGLKMSKNDTVVFSDDDITIFTEIFKKINDAFSTSRIGLIAGLDKNTYQLKKSFVKKFFSSFFLLSPFNENKSDVTKGLFGRLPNNMKKEEIETTWAMGFFFAIKKAIAIDNDLLFDEKLTTYGYAEDLDFSLRYCKKSKESDYKTIVLKDIVVSHNVSSEYRFNKVENLSKIFINRAYINWKNHGSSFLYKLCLWWANIGYRLSIHKIVKKSDVKTAYNIYKKHKKEIYKGQLSKVTYTN